MAAKKPAATAGAAKAAPASKPRTRKPKAEAAPEPEPQAPEPEVERLPYVETIVKAKLSPLEKQARDLAEAIDESSDEDQARLAGVRRAIAESLPQDQVLREWR